MQASPPSTNPLLTLLDLVESPLLLFNPDGHVVFTNRAAKAMDTRPGMVLPSDARVRDLVRKIGKAQPLSSTEITVEVNSDIGVSLLRCQCAPKPIAGLVAMALSRAPEAGPPPGPEAPVATAAHLSLQQIVDLIKDDLAQPMDAVLQASSAQAMAVAPAVKVLNERLNRLSDLVNVFGDDVLIGDQRLMLPDMVRSVCQELAPAAQVRGVKFVLEGDLLELPPVYGSSKLIRRALSECLSNAIAHARGEANAEQAPAIRVGFVLSGQHLMITVANMGVLNAKVLARHASAIFQAESIDSGTKGEGTPPLMQIGLPLTHRILELHGGRLRIEDGNGELEVRLELPTGAPLKSNHHLDLLQAHIYAEDLSTLLARSRKRSTTT